MKAFRFFSLFLCTLFFWASRYMSQAQSLPDGFVFLTEVDPTIIESSRYSTDQNFVGRPVAGYTTSRIICTQEAAERLRQVHDDLKGQGYKLVVYDGYRPQRASDDFRQWSHDQEDQKAREFYFPTMTKRDLFDQAYVAARSTHSRGSTFDLTLILSDHPLQPPERSRRNLTNGEETPFLDDGTLDMGSSFDLFHVVSHHDSHLITQEQTARRNVLRIAMQKFGFKAHDKEWWHYTLENEPYPDTYFDFVWREEEAQPVNS